MGRLEPKPDGHEPGVRIIQVIKTAPVELMKIPVHIRAMVADVLQEIPDPDFIEIRAIKFEAKEGTDERSTGTALPGTEGD